MAVVPKKLYQGALGTTVVNAYTAVGKKVIVKNILVTNTSQDSAVIDLYAVPSGGQPGVANKIISQYEIAANDVISLDISLVLESGDSVQVAKAADGTANVYISGVEVS